MFRTLGPLLAAAILLVVPAEATTTYYTGATGEALFNAGLTGLSLLDPGLMFTGTPGSTGLLNADGTGIDFLGFNDFTTLTPKTFSVSSGKLTAVAPNEVVEINFPASGVYAFGIDITTTTGLGNWCVDLTTSGCNNNPAETAPATVFFGFISTTPVTAPLYIHALNSGPTIVFTSFEAYSTSEPRSMLLVGLGLITLALLRRNLMAG